MFHLESFRGKVTVTANTMKKTVIQIIFSNGLPSSHWKKTKSPAYTEIRAHRQLGLVLYYFNLFPNCWKSFFQNNKWLLFQLHQKKQNFKKLSSYNLSLSSKRVILNVPWVYLPWKITTKEFLNLCNRGTWHSLFSVFSAST